MAETTIPVFRPTLEEMAVGLQQYIETIEPQVQPHGLCKIVPPEGWWTTKPNYRELIDSTADKKLITAPVRGGYDPASPCSPGL